jgi:hypothetical protein
MQVRLGTMMLVAGLLTGSAAMADSPPPPRSLTFCTEVYQPVCGTKDNTRRTYSNRCFANVDQATDIADGPCGPADGSPTKPQ